MDQDSMRLTRRDFLRSSAAVSAAALMARLGTNYAFAQGDERMRVGLIGCGGRGAGAAADCAKAHPSVQIVALADVFKDRLENTRGRLTNELRDQLKVTDAQCFIGFDSYKRLIASGVDLVLLATPPGFRPVHLQAAIEAGKHVFAEKPFATDPAGVRMVLATSALADQKKLAIVAGTQRRHQASYIETIRRIHEGALGTILSARCYWNQGGMWKTNRQPGWSDVEWQLRNWQYFTYLSGDHIVEQHVHNLDVINWVLNAHPISAYGTGGRQQRTDSVYGNIYDHFTVEYEYPNGVRVTGMCRQMNGTTTRIEEIIVGTKGTANPNGTIKGATPFRYERGVRSPYEQEHVDLINSIREGKPINEAQRMAESTLTAIMGRESAYTGKQISWDTILNAKLQLMPETMALGSAAVEPVPTPGKTTLERPGVAITPA